MASNGLVFRAGRGPSCVLVGLVCVIIILCYSYWGLSSNNQRLIKDVSILEDHLRVLAARKLVSDKKNTMLTSELTQVQKEKEKVEGSIRERNMEISDAKNQLQEKGDELSKLHDQEKIYKEELEKLKIGVNGSSSQLKALATKAELLLEKFNEAKANHSALLEKIVKITAEREACKKSLEAMRSELGRPKSSQAKSHSTVKETYEGEYPNKKQSNKVDEKKKRHLMRLRWLKRVILM